MPLPRFGGRFEIVEPVADARALKAYAGSTPVTRFWARFFTRRESTVRQRFVVQKTHAPLPI